MQQPGFCCLSGHVLKELLVITPWCKSQVHEFWKQRTRPAQAPRSEKQCQKKQLPVRGNAPIRQTRQNIEKTACALHFNNL